MKRLLALFLCILLVAPVLAGCGLVYRLDDLKVTGPGKVYDVDDRGEQELAGVDNIVIGTVSDNVIIQSGGSKIEAELKGQCTSVTKPVWLETRREGGTVTIEVKYPQTISSNNTNLTITIPAEYTGGMKVGTVSGSINAEGLPFKLQNVDMGAVSGSVNFSTASYTHLKAGSISGDVTVSGILAQTDVLTTSGGINLDYVEFARTTATSISGDVNATILGAALFKVDFGTISGSFQSSHPGLNISSADHGFSGSVSGATELFKVNTTSGNFRISGK